jgi:hypothetical protein|tara:strand:+ start:552 stop:884 length:333 start_codon:yes stop_codon:yes gene_type:complete
MTQRKKLNNRRVTETFVVKNTYAKLYCSIGLDEEEQVKEVFYTGRGKGGSDMDTLLYDIGVLISIALQNNIKIEELLNSCCKNSDGTFASPIGMGLEKANAISKESEVSK